MDECKEALKEQIADAAGNVQYTFVSHWNIVNRLKKEYWIIKIVQIVLTAISSGGFLVSIISGISQLSWIGGLTSTVALGINLYTLNFNLPEMIKLHNEAANDLWEVREKYRSLLVDFDFIDAAEIRNRRDAMIMEVSKINKKYPGTDEKSFAKAQNNIGNYKFEDGEALRVLHLGEGRKKE